MRIYEDLRGLQTRLSMVQSVVAAIIVLLLVHFWQLQVIKGNDFRAQAENNRLRPVVLPAARGALFDRNGRILAENRSSFNVVLTPEHGDDIKRTLPRLAQLLRLDEGQLQERVRARSESRMKSIVIKADATPEDVAAIEARRLEQPEASVEVVPVRSYPLATAAAHVLGRVGEITEPQLRATAFQGVDPGAIVGQAGVEAQYNRALMGQDGQRRVIVNSRGVEVEEAERKDPVTGPSATLTLDVDLQRALEDAMAGHSGSAVALDPRSGEVLAMLSTPAYDPNQFSTGILPAAWGRLLADPATPLMNRVIQGQYPAGSTFKVLIALAALEEGLITPATTFHCPGYLSIYGTVFRCHREEGHGTLDLKHALALSCNVYFYQVGVKLEIDRISRYAQRLGLNAPTGIDLPHEASGLIPSREWKQRTQKTQWYAGETVSVAIGQGQVTVTPLQLARLAAVVANGGRLVRPHLLRSLSGVPPTPDRADVVDLGLRPETIAAVREGMLAVVSEGSGRLAQVPGLQIGGKTGSAQVVTHARLERDKNAFELQPHGWFLCFAPADAPRIAMAILVEHGRSGGASAAPVAGQVLARYFGLARNPALPGPVEASEPVVARLND